MKKNIFQVLLCNFSGLRCVICSDTGHGTGVMYLKNEMNQEEIKFQQFVLRHKATIYSVCYMYASDRSEADDIFQEVLINLWRGLEHFRADSSERSWVYRVSLNTCLTFKRKKRVSTVSLDIAPEVFEPETEVGRQTEILHERISRLEPLDRAMVLLWLENMSYDEISAVLGLPPKSVGVRLLRIKEKLKKMN